MSDIAGGFGTRLRSWRRSAGLSQQELAERAGLSVRAISDLECGRTRFPYQDTLVRLADALGLYGLVRMDFLMTADRRLAPAASAGTAAADEMCRGRCRWHCPPVSPLAAGM